MSEELSEFYYGDDKFDRRQGEPDQAQRQAIQQSWVKTLRRRDHGQSPSQERLDLADLLEGCKRRHRCNSAACLLCATAFQRWLIEAIQGLCLKKSLSTTTLIIPTLNRPIGDLNSLKLPSAKRLIYRKFEAAEAEHVPVIGFLDISHNTHAHGAWPDHWAPHAVCCFPSEFTPDLKRLAKSLPRDPRSPIKRPGRVDPIENHEEQLSYIAKPRATRRISFDSFSFKARPSKRWLKRPELIELLLWLSAYSPDERLYLQKVRRYQDRLTHLR
jgi:hypothetical protein